MSSCIILINLGLDNCSIRLFLWFLIGRGMPLGMSTQRTIIIFISKTRSATFYLAPYAYALAGRRVDGLLEETPPLCIVLWAGVLSFSRPRRRFRAYRHFLYWLDFGGKLIGMSTDGRRSKCARTPRGTSNGMMCVISLIDSWQIIGSRTEQLFTYSWIGSFRG